MASSTPTWGKPAKPARSEPQASGVEQRLPLW
jgi:hypothetical protein